MIDFGVVVFAAAAVLLNVSGRLCVRWMLWWRWRAERSAGLP